MVILYTKKAAPAQRAKARLDGVTMDEQCLRMRAMIGGFGWVLLPLLGRLITLI